jgi:site-specific DNA-methyltransferase (adenine-specific)
MTDLKIEYLPVTALKPYERNARKHRDMDVDAIVKSIEEFGFDDPIGIWSADNLIVEGHGRLLAAKKLGMKTVPCIRLDHLTDEQRRAYALAHNKTAENSEWDFDILPDELDSIVDIDMSQFGFELPEDQPDEVVEDDVPDVPEEPICKVGDIWQLGRHRLICGDSTDPAVIDRLMDGTKADIAITSPPYGASHSAKIRDHYVKGAETDSSFYNSHSDDIREWDNLIRKSFDTMSENSIAQFINIQMLADNKRDLIRFVSDNADKLIDVIIWDKKKAPPQMHENVLNNQFEFVFIFGGESRIVPFANFHGNINNIIQITTGNNEFSDVHRAVFPVAFPCELMNIAKDAKTVLDVFGGTGTTMIACEQLGRTCFMSELDPKYCDVIIQRWEKFTGGKAVLIGD